MAARDLRVHARPRLPRLGRAGEGARRLPAVQRRPVPLRRQLRLAPAGGDQGARSASTASATRTCCRSRPPARSRSPSPTTPPTASSRPSRGSTRARSAWPTARTRSTRSRTTPGACTSHLGGDVAQAAALLRHRAGDLGARAQGDGGGGRALRRHQHLQDGERAGGLPVRGLRGPLPGGLEVRPEGPHHLPPEQRARRGAVASTRRQAPRRSSRRTSTPPTPTAASCIKTAARSRCSPACAGPAARACPTATRRGPTWSSHPHGKFALFVGHVGERPSRCPFEVWVNGTEQPRGLGAVAKTLSMDMRAEDRAWLAEARHPRHAPAATTPSTCAMPPHGENERVPERRRRRSAQVVRYRVEQLGGASTDAGAVARCSTPCSRRRSRRPAPTARCPGPWTSLNPASGDDFVLGLKEITLPDGVTRPYSMWLSGDYPRALDGLSQAPLARHARHGPGVDRHEAAEAARTTPSRSATSWPSCPASAASRTGPRTVAYVARLIIHRYAMLGVLDEHGYPTQEMGILEAPRAARASPRSCRARCARSAATTTVIRKDGCDFCTACGAVGACG